MKKYKIVPNLNVGQGQYTEYGITYTNFNILRSKGFGSLLTQDIVISQDVYLLPVILNGKIGFINSFYEVVIEPQYDNILGNFNDENSMVIALKEKKWGLINIKNEIILPFKYNQLSFTTIGLFYAVEYGSKTNGFIDLNSNLIIPNKYRWIDQDFYGGLARVIISDIEGNEKWGIINLKAEYVVEPKYDKIWTFSSKRTSTKAFIDGREMDINLTILRAKQNHKEDEDFRYKYYDDEHSYNDQNGSKAQVIMTLQ